MRIYLIFKKVFIGILFISLYSFCVVRADPTAPLKEVPAEINIMGAPYYPSFQCGVPFARFNFDGVPLIPYLDTYTSNPPIDFPLAMAFNYDDFSQSLPPKVRDYMEEGGEDSEKQIFILIQGSAGSSSIYDRENQGENYPVTSVDVDNIANMLALKPHFWLYQQENYVPPAVVPEDLNDVIKGPFNIKGLEARIFDTETSFAKVYSQDNLRLDNLNFEILLHGTGKNDGFLMISPAQPVIQKKVRWYENLLVWSVVHSKKGKRKVSTATLHIILAHDYQKASTNSRGTKGTQEARVDIERLAGGANTKILGGSKRKTVEVAKSAVKAKKVAESAKNVAESATIAMNQVNALMRLVAEVEKTELIDVAKVAATATAVANAANVIKQLANVPFIAGLAGSKGVPGAVSTAFAQAKVVDTARKEDDVKKVMIAAEAVAKAAEQAVMASAEAAAEAAKAVEVLVTTKKENKVAENAEKLADRANEAINHVHTLMRLVSAARKGEKVDVAKIAATATAVATAANVVKQLANVPSIAGLAGSKGVPGAVSTAFAQVKAVDTAQKEDDLEKVMIAAEAVAKAAEQAIMAAAEAAEEASSTMNKEKKVEENAKKVIDTAQEAIKQVTTLRRLASTTRKAEKVDVAKIAATAVANAANVVKQSANVPVIAGLAGSKGVPGAVSTAFAQVKAVDTAQKEDDLEKVMIAAEAVAKAAEQAVMASALAAGEASVVTAADSVDTLIMQQSQLEVVQQNLYGDAICKAQKEKNKLDEELNNLSSDKNTSEVIEVVKKLAEAGIAAAKAADAVDIPYRELEALEIFEKQELTIQIVIDQLKKLRDQNRLSFASFIDALDMDFPENKDIPNRQKTRDIIEEMKVFKSIDPTVN